MPRGTEELKFCTPLTQAFAALKHASANARSIKVLCFPRSEWADEFAPILESLIEAESHRHPQAIDLCLWTAWEHSPYSPISSSITQKIERLRTLSALQERSNSLIILTSLESWIQPTLPVDRGFSLDHGLEDGVEFIDGFRFRETEHLNRSGMTGCEPERRKRLGQRG